MTILVIGGTGTVGSETVRRLVDKGARVRVMTRSAEKAGAVGGGAEGVVGDLARPQTLPPVFSGVESLFLLTPLSRTETDEGLAAVEAAREAGVRRIVYMTVHKLEAGAHIPHFGSKIPVAKAVRESGIPWTLLEPSNFFQNDYWFQEPITQHGVYPQPIGDVGLSRVDVRDIADAAVTALTEPGHEGQSCPLVGPEAWTGPETAAAWGRHLGREVAYGGNDLDAWAEQARQMMPDWLVHDLCVMYQWFQDNGLIATPEDLERTARILGRGPRAFDDFAAETAAQWKG